MSATPNNLPKRTRVLAKDLLFQEKYSLTDTQVDIMSYIFNAFVWAMKVDGYIILTTKKFGSDLPQIGEKTLDASLRELKNRDLIETKLVKIASWGNARVRGIKITPYGMEYNSSLYAPTHQAIVNAFQEEIKELKDRLEREAKSESEALTPKDKTVDSKSLKEAKAVDSKSQNEAKAVDSKSQNRDKTINSKNSFNYKSLEDFVREIRSRFILTSEPICNMVDGWQKETTFYINSYGKLSITSPTIDFLQISNPVEVNKFWKWLFKNQHRVGDIIDLNDHQILLEYINRKYKNLKIKIANNERWIYDIILVKDRFAIRTKDKKGTIFIISDAYKTPQLYSYNECENYILKLKNIAV